MTFTKIFYTTLFSFLLFGLSLSNFCEAEEPLPAVIVSIAPYKFFVNQIAGKTVDVKLMVPTGGSPHSFEPTVRQILEASKAKIWFIIGETFEERALQALKYSHSDMKIVDMRSGISLIGDGGKEHETCTHHHHGYDPHIWLSPRLVKKQAAAISESLMQAFPKNAELYRNNLKKFEAELDALDKDIITMLQRMKNRTILVSHPAFAYYCRDYGLTQVSIEFEGKEPSPQHLTRILELARKTNSPVVYIQSQHPSKGAKLVANQIHAKLIDIDPLSENYFENMRELTRSFSAQ